MAPKNKSGSKKNRRQEDADFDKILQELQRATNAIGQEKSKQRAREEKVLQEKERRREEIRLQASKAQQDPFQKALERQQQQLKFQQLLQQLMASRSAFLTAPKTNIALTSKSNHNFEVSVGEMQGWRSHMEDAHMIDLALAPNTGFFGVFDGHSGRECSTKASALLPVMTRRHFDPQEMVIDFHNCYTELDNKLRGNVGEAGSTAVSVLVTPKKITCASVGDSRAVLCRGGTAIPMSFDHKPENEEERKRIEAAGGHVAENRVNRQLAMSRALGDFQYKNRADLPHDAQLVIAVPDIISHDRQEDDEYIVVACDGIFDVLTNDELISFVNSNRRDGVKGEKLCEAVCNRCLAPKGPTGEPATPLGTDNMTFMIVELLA